MLIICMSWCNGRDPLHVAALIRSPRPLGQELVVVVHDEPEYSTQPDATHAYDAQPDGTVAHGTQPDAALAYDVQRDSTLAYDLDAFARATFALDDDGAPPPGEP